MSSSSHHSHKAGSLKQSNKKHKGKASKRAQDRSFGAGKVAGVAKLPVNTSGPLPTNSKGTNARLDRANKLNQRRKTKLENVFIQRRLGSLRGPPKLVSVIALSGGIAGNGKDCVSALIESGHGALFEHDSFASGAQAPTGEQMQGFGSQHGSVATTAANSTIMGRNLVHVAFDTHKARCSFQFHSNRDDIRAVVDAAKLSDIILFVVDINLGESIVDDIGSETIAALKALGCPEVLCCLTGFGDSTARKKKVQPHVTRKTATRVLESHLQTTGLRVVEVGGHEGSGVNAVRTLCNMRAKTVNWKDMRSYAVAQHVVNTPTRPEDLSGGCPARIIASCWLRGKPLSVNSLVHVEGAGIGRIVKISTDGSRQHSAETIMADPNEQDEMVADIVPGDSDAILRGEQTWPEEFEIDRQEVVGAEGPAADRSAGRDRRAVNASTAAPVGMSSYQADWYVDESGQADFDGEEDGGDELDTGGLDNDDDDDDDAPKLVSFGGQLAVGKSGFSRTSASVEAQLQDDLRFPDEVDTPHDISVRDRYARYRALQSFRSSPWHPKENLPADYSRIYQFENFAGMQRMTMNTVKMAEKYQNASTTSSQDNSAAPEGAIECVDEDVPSKANDGFLVPGMDGYVRSGQFVHVEIEMSTATVADIANLLSKQGFLGIYALYSHENKVSVLHFNIQRMGSNSEPIKSKDTLLFQMGFRSFLTKPIFSESNLNCDKHKLDRFLVKDRFGVASCYGPLSMAPHEPLLVYKEKVNPLNPLVRYWELVAFGSLMSVDPDRIILKKIVLSGIPIRVRKRYAVVRHLFHDPQDVRWFKPAQLVTKMGLRGHIKEPVGTHGLLKSYFSGPIVQNDTVLLMLYKRVYPKFPSETLNIV